ncbi:unnamed protein product [Porites evermanni]|uniref:G-protein coupled receptors family 1 profile domain-containing protein n=1 Tax=Porites evermanni TaxID=104178 RepID=A0ABN8MJA5_9CNID|nr:unnamed protein product [Porites evermanni]
MDSSYLVVGLLNAFLSYTATMLNIVTIHAIRKTPSLSTNLKTLLLSLAVSDLGVGLVVQLLYVALRIMESKLNIETGKTYHAIYIAFLLPANLFISATLFLVIVLCAERFIAIHYYLRYQELVTHKRRVVTVVVSTWVLSGLFSLTRLWIPKSIMYVVFGITQLACIIAATFFSIRIYLSVRLHVNEIQVLQLQHAPQNAQMVNVRRMQKFAMMSVYVCLVLTVCYLPNICTLFAIAFTSTPSNGVKHLQFYTVTLVFLNSSLNPVIYCWKMKHIRHTIIGFIRNAFTKQN